jgi:hypothetical protein
MHLVYSARCGTPLPSECMRIVSSFIRTAEDRIKIGEPWTADGCSEPSIVLAPTAEESTFSHVASSFEREVLVRHLGGITCCVQVRITKWQWPTTTTTTTHTHTHTATPPTLTQSSSFMRAMRPTHSA